ncbi:MAG: glycosyltransferase, partial [Candidatus Paceibacterota bacterium]
MKKEILVSVIIPARNSEKYLGACLRSVLAQDFENFEVIAVDNNSTDGTKEIISGLAEKHQNLKYVFEPKIGRGAARNTGEKQAKGEVILMTDSDCVAPKGWVRAMAGPILAKEAVAVQGGEIGLKQNFWSRQADLRAEERFEAFKRGDRMVMVDTKNFAIGRQFLEKLGFSSRSFARGNDTDLAIRLLKKEIIPVIKNDIRVAHEHCDNFLAVARKYFWGGFWCQKITTAHHFFLRQTNFLKETEQARKPIRESLSNLRATIFDKGFGYLLFDLVTGVAWRFGLARSRRKSAPVLGKKCERSFDESITVLVPVRNRYDYRIKNCLKSLRGQSHKQSLLKIIIIDYGSEKRHKNFFGGLCEEFNARGIWTGRKNEVWNKSKCLNLGLREVKSKYVLVADVDVVLERSYLETCVSIAGEFKDGVGLYPGILDCSKGAVDSGTDVVGNFNRLVKQSTYRGDKYEGHFPYGVGILFTETEILKQLGGYDEFYESWGSEDLDMMNRLQN